jgi:hypothetical protein
MVGAAAAAGVGISVDVDAGTDIDADGIGLGSSEVVECISRVRFPSRVSVCGKESEVADSSG